MTETIRRSRINYKVCLVILALFLPATVYLCVRTFAAGGATPERIMLSLTETPATGEAVTWRTTVEVKKPQAQITVAAGGTDLEKNAWTLDAETEAVTIGRETVYEHSAVFKALKPNTLYAYRVGGGGVWSEWNQFRTADDSLEPFSFVFLGDPQVQLESMCSRVFREAYKKAPGAAFWLFAGDTVNQGEDDGAWGELFSALGWVPRTTPMLFIPGNHEYKKTSDKPRLEANKPISFEEKGLTRLWRPQFNFPLNGPKGLEETAYYFDYQGVRFVMLNGNEGLEDQAKWLNKILAKDPQRWTIVTIHQPFYSTGEDRDNPYNRQLFVKLFDKYSVDLLLQGHDHTYGRTWKLRNGVKQDENAPGTVYVVSVSGPKQYDPNKRFESLMAKTGANKQLFQIISVDKNRLVFESYTAAGELFDSFVLKKQ